MSLALLLSGVVRNPGIALLPVLLCVLLLTVMAVGGRSKCNEWVVGRK
ncbi:hypothetical protein H2549_004838 [Salmonella enterica subsp. enterica serovar Stanley]|nr:hypothetical protein [Salmonella enterica subsp. enterica serovar Stanley]